MVAFSVFSIPLFFLFLQSVFFPEDGPRCLFPFVRGIVLGIPAMLLLWLIRELMPPDYTGPGLYLSVTFSDVLFYPLMVTVAFLLVRKRGRTASADSTAGAVSFFAGAFAFLGLLDIVLHEYYRTLYLLFLLPLLRFSLVLLVPILLARVRDERGFMQVLPILLLASLPFILGLIPFFYYTNYLFPSIAATLAAVGGAGALFWRSQKKA